MNIYLCGVFSGTFTGQIQTLFGIKESLKNQPNFRIIEAPETKYSFPIIWIKYLITLIRIMLFGGQKNLYYLVLNRSKLSFWLRDLPIFLLALLSNSKLICHLVGSDIEEFIKRLNLLETILVKFFFKRIGTWVLLGDSMKKQVEDVYDSLGILNTSICFNEKKLNAHIIRGFFPDETYKFINDNLINKKIENFGLVVNIGFMSNLIETKGVVEFIETVIYLKEKKNINIKAWIAGVTIGRRSNRLEKALLLARSKNYIEICGLIFGDKKWQKLLNTSIFILPSYYRSEALPLSLVEAMRSGCLCIASDIGEVSQIIDSNNGFLISEVSTENIINAVEKSLSDLELSKSKIKNSYRFVNKNFSLTEYKKRVNKLIEINKLDL